MSPAQQDHVKRLTEDFASKVFTKYENGVRQHGGNLWEVAPEQVLEFAMDEVLDQWVYLFTLKEQLESLKSESTVEADNPQLHPRQKL